MSPSPKKPTPEPSWAHFVEGLRAFVRNRVPAQDAEDVAQEALLRIHESAATLRDPSRTQAWVFAVARRTVADFYRKRRPADGADPAPLETLADPSAAVAEKLATYAGDHSAHEEVLTWLRPIAEGLPEGYREALLLADFDGRTQRQVAEELGLSLPGAKSRVQRARRMLAAELEKCCSVELGTEGRVQDFKRNHLRLLRCQVFRTEVQVLLRCQAFRTPQVSAFRTVVPGVLGSDSAPHPEIGLRRPCEGCRTPSEGRGRRPETPKLTPGGGSRESRRLLSAPSGHTSP